MKSRGKYILIGIVFVFFSLVLLAYVSNRESANRQNEMSKSTSSKTEANVTEPSPQIKDGSQTSEKGKYIEYSEDEVARTAGTRVLFFHAPWCPQCRMLDEDIKKAAIPDGVTIFKTDYDSNQALRQKYGVTLQTTFIKLNATGGSAQKYVAYNEPNFDAVKTNLLQ